VERYLSLSAHDGLNQDRLAKLLADFDCPPASTPISEVDVGTRRLIAVAATLAGNPSLVLLDEPAAGLGLAESARLAARITEIPERFGCAVLLVEHDMELVAACCEVVTVLDYGQVIATGPPDKVLRDPRVRQAYLGVDLPSPTSAVTA